MTSPPVCRVRRGSPTCRRDLGRIVEAVSVAELLHPSRCVWLAAPTLGDAAVLDNRAGQLGPLEPRWGNRAVGLADWLLRVLGGGTAVVVATTPDPETAAFLARLTTRAAEVGLAAALNAKSLPTLPRAGLVGDDFLLAGALHFGQGIVMPAEDAVTLDLRPDAVAEARVAFRTLYGGPADVR
jgi:hypothetical protein